MAYYKKKKKKKQKEEEVNWESEWTVNSFQQKGTEVEVARLEFPLWHRENESN